MNRKLTMSELNRTDLEAYKTQAKVPLVLVADNIRSLHNVGALFRTADALAIEKIYLVGVTAKPPHREIQKSALGATESVEWEYISSAETCQTRLNAEGKSILVLEQLENSTPLEAIDKLQAKEHALIVGNEVSGISDCWLNEPHTGIEIKQFGTKHSLNVSVSAGIALWQICRQLR